MKNSQKIKQFKTNQSQDSNKSDYQGLSKHSNNFRSQYDKDSFSPYQTLIYKRTLIGLKFYSQEEQNKMSAFRKEYIRTTHIKAQQELNLLKQKRIIEVTNSWFGMFTRSTIAKDLIDMYSKPTRNFWSDASLSDLDITKQDVINHFCKQRILPDFFQSL